MDAMGKDIIVVETVGVGQDEIDIAQMAHSTLLVTVPGMGDDIQAIKAGILEVADVFIVNKSDLDGADRTVRELRQIPSSGPRHPPPAAGARPAALAEDLRRWHAPRTPPPSDEWEPPILAAIAARDQG